MVSKFQYEVSETIIIEEEADLDQISFSEEADLSEIVPKPKGIIERVKGWSSWFSTPTKQGPEDCGFFEAWDEETESCEPIPLGGKKTKKNRNIKKKTVKNIKKYKNKITKNRRYIKNKSQKKKI